MCVGACWFGVSWLFLCLYCIVLYCILFFMCVCEAVLRKAHFERRRQGGGGGGEAHRTCTQTPASGSCLFSWSCSAELALATSMLPTVWYTSTSGLLVKTSRSLLANMWLCRIFSMVKLLLLLRSKAFLWWPQCWRVLVKAQWGSVGRR